MSNRQQYYPANQLIHIWEEQLAGVVKDLTKAWVNKESRNLFITVGLDQLTPR